MDKPINSKIDFILSYGQEHLESVIEQVKQRLVDKLGEYYQFTDYLTLVTIARDILSELEPMLAKIMSDAQIAAWATGVDNVIGSLPKTIPAESLEKPGQSTVSNIPSLFEKPPELNNPQSVFQFPDKNVDLTKIDLAVKDLTSRKVVTRQKFDTLSRSVKQQAFTVAYQDKEETIDKIRTALATSIQTGIGKQSFQAELDKVFDHSPMSKWHQNVVLRTNTLSALASGRDTIGALPEIQDAFPFSAYYATHDDRTRPEHLALESLGLLKENGEMSNVYWNSDVQFWSLFACPWAFGCRCVRSYIGLKQAAEIGIAVAIEWMKTGIRPPMQSCLPNVPFRPDPNFVGGGRLLAV